jgi:hypothetical protein
MRRRPTGRRRATSGRSFSPGDDDLVNSDQKPLLKYETTRSTGPSADPILRRYRKPKDLVCRQRAGVPRRRLGAEAAVMCTYVTMHDARTPLPTSACASSSSSPCSPASRKTAAAGSRLHNLL